MKKIKKFFKNFWFSFKLANKVTVLTIDEFDLIEFAVLKTYDEEYLQFCPEEIEVVALLKRKLDYITKR